MINIETFHLIGMPISGLLSGFFSGFFWEPICPGRRSFASLKVNLKEQDILTLSSVSKVILFGFFLYFAASVFFLHSFFDFYGDSYYVAWLLGALLLAYLGSEFGGYWSKRFRHIGNFCFCSECEKRNYYATHHTWDDGCKCITCGDKRNENHNWDNGCKCITCGDKRNENHNWDNGCKCITCGDKRNENHDWDGCYCKICKADNHRWSDWEVFSPCHKKRVCLQCSFEEDKLHHLKESSGQNYISEQHAHIWWACSACGESSEQNV